MNIGGRMTTTTTASVAPVLLEIRATLPIGRVVDRAQRLVG